MEGNNIKIIDSKSQQLNLHKEIVDKIVNLLYDNRLSVKEANEILHIASKKIMQQKLTACL